MLIKSIKRIRVQIFQHFFEQPLMRIIMNHPNFWRKQRLPLGTLLALSLSASLSPAAQVDPIVVAPVASSYSVDSTATDFYIFGDNVSKYNGGGLFTDVTATVKSISATMALPTATSNKTLVSWSNGTPTASSTGSAKSDYCPFGQGFGNTQATHCSFTLTMPSAEGTLEFWLVPNSNVSKESITYRVSVGNITNSFENSGQEYRRFTTRISAATPGEIITVTVDNVTAPNRWHNIGFQAVQFTRAESPIEQLPQHRVGEPAFSLSANTSSGLPVKFELTAETTVIAGQKVCELSGNQVKPLKVGTCVLLMTQEGDATYKPVQKKMSFEIVKGMQTIPAFPEKANVGDSLTVTATSGLSVTLSSDSEICSVNSDKVTFNAAGTCVLNATQSGNEDYLSTTQNGTVLVSELILQEQNLSLQLTPATGIVGDTLSISVSPGESNNSVTLSSSTTDICSVQNTSVTLLKEGTCTVSATQAGNANYLEASASSSVTVKTDKATFGLKVLSNKNNSGELTQVSQTDTVNIELKVTAAPKDVGKTAELFLTAQLGNAQYILSDKGWQPWDGVTWIPVIQQVLTAETFTIPAFTGVFSPISGVLEFSATYRIKGSSALSQNPQAVGNLTVTAANPAEQAKTDCLEKGGIYYAQQCFTDVKDLGNGFTGGIYVEGQTGLQTNVNLPCRLGKKVAVLGRFNASDADVGKPAEVMLALNQNKVVSMDNATSKAIGALPNIYSAAFFEGELPTTGNFATYLGYRLLNSDGTKGELKYTGGLSLSAPIESCDNPSLKLNTLPLGTGKGEVMTKTNDDGSVRLIATVATDGSVFRGWIGDAKGCEGNETTVTIKPISVAFTCQPIFISKQVLGTFNCVNGFDTKQNMACCDINDPKCPAIPSPCNPPALPSNVKWIINFPDRDAADIGTINITNLSYQATIVRATLYDVAGVGIFADKLLNGGIALNPLTTLRLSAADVAAQFGKWTGRAILKLVADEGIDLKVQLMLRSKASNILTDMTHSSTKHRLYTINPPGVPVNRIRVTNLGDDRAMLYASKIISPSNQKAIAARFFVDGKIGFATSDFIPTLAQHETRYFLAADLSKLNNNTDWKADQKTWIEIFPVKVEERCRGDLLLQLIKTNEVNVAPSVNFTPVE
jgi:hypothetical protein